MPNVAVERELIQVIQLPQLKEQFADIGKAVAEKVERCNNLAVTDDNYKDIKKIRAELNKEAKAYDDEFKAVKARVLEPWDDIEIAYRENIKTGYKMADEALKEKIVSVEDDLKAEKAAEVMHYFEEHKIAMGLDFIPWEAAGIKVGMSNSMKSLKEAAKGYLDKIADDVEMINNSDDIAAEAMAEFKENGFNAAKAILAVRTRRERIEAEKEAAEKARQEKEANDRRIAEIEANLPQCPEPVEPPEVCAAEPEKEKIFTARFMVQGTKAQLMALSDFLKAGNYNYRNIKEEQEERNNG